MRKLCCWCTIHFEFCRSAPRLIFLGSSTQWWWSLRNFLKTLINFAVLVCERMYFVCVRPQSYWCIVAYGKRLTSGFWIGKNASYFLNHRKFACTTMVDAANFQHDASVVQTVSFYTCGSCVCFLQNVLTGSEARSTFDSVDILCSFVGGKPFVTWSFPFIPMVPGL